MVFCNSLDEVKHHFEVLKEKWAEAKTAPEIQFPEFIDEKLTEVANYIFSKDSTFFDEYISLNKEENDHDDFDEEDDDDDGKDYSLKAPSEMPSDVFFYKVSGILNETKVIIEKGATIDMIFHLSTPADKIRTFNKYQHLFDDAEYWEKLGWAYILQDYQSVPYGILMHYFSLNKPGKEFLMTEEEKEFFNNLPDQVTIYRGMSKEEFESGRFRFSWTLKKATAKQFAKRTKDLYEKPTLVHELTVKKEDILCYFNRGEEEEIIYINNLNKDGEN